jgi:tripeptidyl-peptidase-1
MLTVSIFTALLALASASPLRARSPYVVKETHPVPSQWTEVAPAPGSHKIQLQIGLKQSQFDQLEKDLYEGTQYSVPGHTRILISNLVQSRTLHIIDTVST